MPLKFGKKTTATAPAATPAAPATAPAAGAEPEKKRPAFMRGREAAAEMEQASKRDQERREKAGSTRRFYIPKEGGTRSLIFLDGDLDSDGILDIPFFYEHTIPYEGRYESFRCTQKTEPCPLCEMGDDPSYVGVLTVIEEHAEPWKDRDGKEHHYSRRLYVAKLETLKKLQVMAQKREGLRYVQMDVTRAGKRDARVGSSFDFTSKLTKAELVAAVEDPKHAEAATYDQEPELVYRDAAELRKLGLGSDPGKVVGRVGEGKRNIDDEL